jgi:hypothetical protein
LICVETECENAIKGQNFLFEKNPDKFRVKKEGFRKKIAFGLWVGTLDSAHSWFVPTRCAIKQPFRLGLALTISTRLPGFAPFFRR